MPSREVTTRPSGLTAHENMDVPVTFFHSRHVYNPRCAWNQFFAIWGALWFPVPPKFGGQ